MDKENKQNKQNKKIVHVLILISLLFLSILVYLTYFEVFQKDKIVTSSYNRRQWQQEDTTQRGSILDKNGIVLAESTINGEKQERNYPYASLYSQIIGYNSRSYGKSLLESQYNNELLNISELSPVLNLKNKLTGDQKTGNNLVLTLDHNLQTKANQLIGDRNGAVVVMRPNTGEVLAMVSKPDFDPTSAALSQNWQSMVESQSHIFVPRATQGLYTPGSTFKVLTTASAIENGMEGRGFNDTGSITIDGNTIGNSEGHAYGALDLKSALAMSSNVAFAQLGVELGEKNLKDITSRAGMNKEVPFDIPVSTSRFPYKSMSKADMAAIGMGQGKLQVTPLFMAMVASSIANNGVMMKPYMVDRVVSPSDIVLKSTKPSAFGQVMSAETAAKVKSMMQYVVQAGTGQSAAIPGVAVAGKTGTAENEMTGKQKNKEHAWFICFAPVNDPQVAVAVVLEYSGSYGGETAAPIARELMQQVLAK